MENVIMFEEDYEDIKYDPNQVFMKYHDEIIKIAGREAYKFNIVAEDLISQCYIWFRDICEKYDPYYNDGFIPFRKYLIHMLYANIKNYIQKHYNSGPYSYRKKINTLTMPDEEISILQNNDINVTNIDNKLDLETFLELLPDNYRKALLMNVAGYNQSTIGKEIGLSQFRISKILKHLRTSMTNGVTKNSNLYAAARFIRNYKRKTED